jgi:glycosyltransferase involved in cell wall biosynthesis
LATIPSLSAIASQTGGTVVVGVDLPGCSYRVSSGTSAIRVSVVLPVIDETTSLRKTVDILLAENAPDLAEILIITCRKTSEAALAVCQDLVQEHPVLIQIRTQKRAFLGGAIRDAFEWATGSHVLMMASDLETEPATVKDLIAAARQGYDIATATRWAHSGGFHGYNPLKHLLNLAFQKGFGLLYGTALSDLTYGFRIFKTEWVKKIEWEEQRHAFLLETILKPMRLGARVAEVPTIWRNRTEGISHNHLLQHLAYFRIGFKTRFRSRHALLARTHS